MVNLRSEIRLPPPEIVIDVNRDNSLPLRTRFQKRDFARHGSRRPDDRVVALEFQIVNYVDKQKSDRRLVGNVSMQILVSRWHLEGCHCFCGSFVKFSDATICWINCSGCTALARSSIS